jgi:arabinose-5-phosphate isomerase
LRFYGTFNNHRKNKSLKTDDQQIVEAGKRVIDLEMGALQFMRRAIGASFAEAVKLILGCKGKVIVTGVGKSAIIAQKMVATFNSTGTTAVFLHAADAIHGDLGIVGEEDVAILLSKSGETPELRVLVPLLRTIGNKMIALVGNTASYLAQQSDIILDATIPHEACPNNLAPTSSTTAQLVLGDAIAVSLLECRGFSADDFARIHPGGALGKKLYLRVSDVFARNEKPAVSPDDDLTRVIVEISSKRLGATAVIKKDQLLGIITDGDLRRMLMNKPSLDTVKAENIMTPGPKSISSNALLAEALELMRKNNITQLPVVDSDIYMGVVHLHDIIKEGIL